MDAFFTVALYVMKLAGWVLAVIIVASILTHRAISNWQAEKQRAVIDSLPIQHDKTA